ncbi:amidohydrolase family protein [Fuerstiella marisgermanici]|uniref:Putative metal-dependent hydrolase of the TIM-barrel fold protein n=1 Tax=Fuerstiella marisgermanici TaxID=1891926 RepID=A0A1P8WLC4_9PLAN|nr:amidohydrolase family protein [Fuerstiella marisgermanici]APZ94855.1 putative metal-dependent hydrolase of the TIM-barrel fold protein [Fuerstiella marisgermanici]
MLNRRHLLKLTGVAAAAGTFPVSAAERVEGVIDTNVSLFAWPFRRLPLDSTTKLMQKLRSLNVSQVWAGSFEGLLHRDIAAVNQRLAAECRPHADMVPVGSINLALPGWPDDLQRCAGEHQMKVIRLHPNYHGYTLLDTEFTELLQLAQDASLIVQIVVAMEDGRTQHPQLQVPDTDVQPLLTLKKKYPNVRIQLLNHRLRSPLLTQLAGLPNIYFDTARVDGTDAVPQLVKAVPKGRVLYGSHAPLLIPEAAMIRVHESGRLVDEQLRAVYTDNASNVLLKRASV